MLVIESKGDFHKTSKFLQTLAKGDIYATLDGAGREGVSALASATPKDSGLTASSWDYTIERSGGRTSITWTNSNTAAGKPVAVLLQYGHGTGTGGYVQGMDYINPALRPIFDRIANNVWKAVTTA